MAEKQSAVMSDRQEGQGQAAPQQGTPQGQKRQSPSQQNQGQRQEGMARRQTSLFMNPFSLLGRLAEEMTGVFDEARGSRLQQGSAATAVAAWAPDIDVVRRGNELVVRADLPGVKADDVVVEVGDDAITISGERRQEREEEQEGVYRYERTYGAFLRMIPLPEGAIADQANASFKDGVLEITVPVPPEQVSRGRRLEISQSSDTKSEKK